MGVCPTTHLLCSDCTLTTTTFRSQDPQLSFGMISVRSALAYSMLFPDVICACGVNSKSTGQYAAQPHPNLLKVSIDHFGAVLQIERCQPV
ncbi:hypothetical protein KIN20_014186 [Parelaphostrongylus tenuis]|uniref:Uncharacterized protein n=1 Tax=Parelaphostrongylus tenuis TaxID=148309 RepID=A0AAD5N2X0_PARTN|nr:hypothetical protein KIN20_014186 [Parelaphostrongylus tenuis]